jgi:hypothetical protein
MSAEVRIVGLVWGLREERLVVDVATYDDI